MKSVKLQIKIQNFAFFFVVFLFSFFIFPSNEVNAAEFRLESDASTFGVGDEFLVQVLVDAEGEAINAFQGNVVFPQELLEFKGVRERNSIVSLWIEEPPAFSGLTPGGYEGEGVLFFLVFRAKEEGAGSIGIEQGRALLNDGKGTPTELSIFNYQFSISNRVSGFTFQDSGEEDTEPPEPFEMRVAQDPSVFEGRPFLVFAAQDKNSGVSHYEISFVYSGQETLWARAESPYLLADSESISEIRVKAIDRAGNDRIAALSLNRRESSFATFLLLGNLGILIGIGVIIGFLLWRKRFKGTPR